MDQKKVWDQNLEQLWAIKNKTFEKRELKGKNLEILSDLLLEIESIMLWFAKAF